VVFISIGLGTYGLVTVPLLSTVMNDYTTSILYSKATNRYSKIKIHHDHATLDDCHSS